MRRDEQVHLRTRVDPDEKTPDFTQSSGAEVLYSKATHYQRAVAFDIPIVAQPNRLSGKASGTRPMR